MSYLEKLLSKKGFSSYDGIPVEDYEAIDAVEEILDEKEEEYEQPYKSPTSFY